MSSAIEESFLRRCIDTAQKLEDRAAIIVNQKENADQAKQTLRKPEESVFILENILSPFNDQLCACLSKIIENLDRIDFDFTRQFC